MENCLAAATDAERRLEAVPTARYDAACQTRSKRAGKTTLQRFNYRSQTEVRIDERHETLFF